MITRDATRCARAHTALRGAAAGAIAASAWVATEPLASRALGTGYTDVRLLGRMVPGTGRAWPAAGVAVHVANGAAFGAVAALAGVRGPRAGLALAAAETLATWPVMALMDRVHPDRRSGKWPRPLTDRRIAVQEIVMHSLFGLVLGLLLRRRGGG